MFDRNHVVKVGTAISDLLQICGMGIFLFILMINDLHTEVLIFKYVDDTTIYNISNDPLNNKAQNAMDNIIEWSNDNDMKNNQKKLKKC